MPLLRPRTAALSAAQTGASALRTQGRAASSSSMTMGEAAAAFTPRRALRCPGGNRMTSQGIKAVLKVSSSGQLSRLDQRFILNLKLTHQIMGNLSEHLEGSMGGQGTEGGSEGGKLVLEIGPGPGALTRSLLTREAAGVLGVEIDPRFNSYLEQIHQQTDGKFQWANADIMAADEYSLVKEHFPAAVARVEGAEPSPAGERQSDEADGGDFFGSPKASPSPSSRGEGSTLRNGFHVPLRSTRRETILKRRQHLAFGAGQNSRPLGSTAGSRGAKGPTEEEADEDMDGEEDEEDDFFGGGGEKAAKKKRREERRQLTEAEQIKARWASSAGSSLVVVSNLPFALSTGLLMRYSFDAYSRAGIYKFGRTPVYCLLPQLIANRLIALPPGGRANHRRSAAVSPDAPVNDERLLARSYGRPSVLFQNYFHVRVHRLFSEKTFFPPTDVLGALVQLTPRSAPLVDVEPATLVAFLNTTFVGRLKSRAVGAALRQAMPLEVATYALQQLRVDGAVGIGQLTVREVALLAKVWERYMLGTNQSMAEASERAREAAKAERHAQWEAEAKAAEEAAAAAYAAGEAKEAAAGSSQEEEEGNRPASSEAKAKPGASDDVWEDEGDELLDIMFQSASEAEAEEAGRGALPSEADAFARAAAALDGDDVLLGRDRSSSSHSMFVKRGGGGAAAGQRDSNSGKGGYNGDDADAFSNIERQPSAHDAFVEDAMDFFGYSDPSMGGGGGADAKAKAGLKQMLADAKDAGRATYLRFKSEEGTD